MVQMNLLKERIYSCDMTMTAIAKESGISRETLYNRLNGIGEFTVSEATALTKTLGLTKKERDQIFFNPKVE